MEEGGAAATDVGQVGLMVVSAICLVGNEFLDDLQLAASTLLVHVTELFE